MKLLRILVFCWSFSCLLFSCCKQTSPVDIQLEQLDSLVWANPDSVRSILDTLNYSAWQKTDQYHLQMLHEFCQLKTNRPLSPDSVMPPIVDYFTQTKNYKLLGEALYIQGAEYEWLSDFTKGTDCLKQAESLLLKYEDNPLFLGMNYYKLGRCAEMELLYHIAHQYYQQALPYFQSAEHHYYLASCYRDMARTIPDRFNRIDELNCYYDSALHYAQLAKKPITYYETILFKAAWQTNVDSTLFFKACHYLCDSIGTTNFCDVLSTHYLAEKDITTAEHYFKQFALDTTKNYVSKFRYSYVESLILHAKNQNKEAFQTLKNLYDQRNRLTELNGDAKTVAITKCYDVEREKAQNLQLQVKKKNLTIVIISLVALLFMAISIGIYIILIKNKQQYLINCKYLQEQQNNNLLRKDIKHKGELLRNTIKNHLDMLQEMETEALNSNQDSLRLRQCLTAFTLSNEKNCNKFIHDYNEASCGFLTYLKQLYPNLTDIDMLIIALELMEIPVQQQMMILNTSNRTLYNRKQRLKERLGQNDKNFDKWLKTSYKQYIEQYLKK